MPQKFECRHCEFANILRSSGNLRANIFLNLLMLFLFHSIQNLGFAQDGVLMEPRSYVAEYTAEALNIDGVAEEVAWKMASFSEPFIDIEGYEVPPYQTRVKMLWDNRYLYIYAQMEEPHVWGTLKLRDTVIFYNNDFEVFIDPDGDTHEYYELEVNALNTLWDLLLVKPYRNGGSVIDNWDIKGIQSAVAIDGTLNDSGDKDTGWSVEMALPWDVLEEAAHGPVPPEGRFWRMNFSRVNWDFQLSDGRYSRKKDEQGKYLPEYNWVWSPQQVINMHEPERWGYVYFNPENETTVYSIPGEERLKWELYAVYRDLLDKDGKDGISGDLDLNEVGAITFREANLPVVLHYNDAGWYISCKSPISGNLLMIGRDGKFTINTPTDQ
ncbi:carbohydrate-binding family 9-like protein [Robertkochia marina]|nr:carbohydrate-binding family 9-like protein [Robertkochia marina]